MTEMIDRNLGAYSEMVSLYIDPTRSHISSTCNASAPNLGAFVDLLIMIGEDELRRLAHHQLDDAIDALKERVRAR